MKKLILLLLALFLLVPVICMTSCNKNDDPAECAHTWTEATCTTPKTCTKCHQTEGNALGHEYGEFVETKAPTCTVAGEKTKTCSRCGATESESIPATGEHKYAAKEEITTQPTCTQPGVKTYTCICGLTKTEPIPATGHDYSKDWSSDANHHYHVCLNSGCGAHDLDIPHLDSDKNGTCDACGYGESYKKVTVKTLVGGVYVDVKEILVQPRTALTDAQVAELKAALYQGYGFAAWYSDEACETEFDFTATVSEDTVIYASRGNLAGAKITWSYDEATYTLAFTGEGDMYDFMNLQAVPWNGLTVKNVTFDNGITSIGSYAFYEFALESVNLHEGLKKIGKYAFYNEAALTEVKFPVSLVTIDDYAFNKCTGLTYIDIGGENLEYVGEFAFAECTAAKYVVFGDAIDSSASVFGSCTFTHAYFAGNKAQFDSVEIGFGNLQLDLAYMFFYASYEPQKAGPYWYRSDDGKPAQWCYSIYYIPSDGIKTAIEKDYVFVKNPKITAENIEFRDNIWYNGYQFESWTGNPTFSEGVSLTGDVKYTGGRGSKVGDGVDYNITGNVLSISGSGKMWDFGTVKAAPWNESSTFKNTDITKIEIGSNVTYIGDYAFCNFPNLESVEIKNNIVEMSTKAFYGCANLKYVYYYGNELEALNCKGLKYQENVDKLIVYYQELEKDGICDSCGACIGECVDADEDKLCDLCGKCMNTHTDENEDGKCDVCKLCVGEHVFEKSETKCDVCGTCKNHVDADISFLTSKGIIPTISYWKDVKVGDTTVRITWEYADGVLTVGGEGAMPDFETLAATPWANTFTWICKEESLNFAPINEAVTKIIIRDGITGIGNNAFNGLAAAAEIVLTSDLKRISSTAFASTAFIDNATYDSDGLFVVNNILIKADSTKVSTLVCLPNGLVCIVEGAFEGCSQVTGLRIPKTLNGASTLSYSGLDALESIFFHGTEANWKQNETNSAVPETARVYFFSNKAPTKCGYYWKSLNNPTIYEDWLPDKVHENLEKEDMVYEVITPATCTTPGSAVYKCPHCGEILETVELPVVADAHNFENGACTECGTAEPAQPSEPVEPAEPTDPEDAA